MMGTVEAQDTLTDPAKLKAMSLEELMDLEVTSVSGYSEKLTNVASAIQVITAEDIRRSGATNLPEALLLATNLQMAHFASNAWIIGARGFNAVFANKLLVMIDGRVVYSPLFAGVLWDVQSVLLEDIDRIEVISGPGGVLWGANAVNGVINIITKSSGETQGFYGSTILGTHLRGFGAMRYGGKINEDISYRVFFQHSDRHNSTARTGVANTDQWGLSHGGFRLDWKLQETTNLSVQANAYEGRENSIPGPSTYDGQNALVHLTHDFADDSKLTVQGFFDRTWRRDLPSTISDQLLTGDLEFNHSFRAARLHRIIWGGGYRYIESITRNSSPVVGILPNRRVMPLYSIFVQDEITLAPDMFYLFLGTKLQHNVYTDFEWQPSARVSFTPGEQHNIWAAVSRAVRTPSRLDADYFAPTIILPPEEFSVRSGPDFQSETLIAYELGYRVQPFPVLSLSLAAFYNVYDDLFSVDPIPGTLTYITENRSMGETAGTELSGTWQPTHFWRLRGGYTYLWKELTTDAQSIYDTQALGHDAAHQFLVQSNLTIRKKFDIDLVARYRSSIESLDIPEFFTFNLRLAWDVNDMIEIAVVGRNLYEERHLEYSSYVPRSIFGQVTVRL